MRINQLIISAFGPYASKVKIDFEELNKQELYLITGDTGAGKTSIFDAISFALYGNTSQLSRLASSLRSDFSDNETETYVEMSFTIHNKLYHVKRHPNYIREGYKTENKHKAYLLLPNKEIIEGVYEVNQKIQEIIGIDYMQFKHIMMIAQGEFSQLIHAESKDREVIFRKLFDTSKYNKLEEFFKLKVKEHKGQYLRLKERITTKILMTEGMETKENDIFRMNQFLQELENVNISYDTILSNNKEQRNILNKRIGEMQTTIQNIDANNTLLDHFDVVMQEYHELFKQEEVMTQLSKSIDNGIKAREITPLYEHYNKSNHSYLSLKKEKEQLEEAILESRAEVATIYHKKEELQKEASRIMAKEKQLDSYQNSLSILTRIENEFTQIQLIKQKIKNATTVLEGVNLLLNNNQEQLQRLNEEVNLYKDIALENEQLKQLEITYNQKMHSLRLFEKELKEYIIVKENYDKEVVSYQNIDSFYQKKNQEYLHAEIIFRQNQAGMLASGLKDNEPCPVCGSLHHPSRAIISEEALSLSSLEELKEELEAIYKDRESRYQIVITTKEDIVRLTASMEAKMENKENDYSAFLLQEKKILKEEVYLLSMHKQELTRKQSNKAKVEKQLITLEEEIETTSKDKESMIKQIETLKTNLQIKLQTIATLKETSSFVDKDKLELETLIKQILQEINKYKEAIAYYEEEYHSKNLQLEGKQGRLLQIIEQVNKDTIFVEDLKNKYQKKVYENFKSEEEYLNSCMDEEEIPLKQNIYQAYKDSCLLKKKEMEELKDKTKGLIKKENTELKEEVLEKQKEVERLATTYADIYAKMQKNVSILEEVSTEKEIFNNLEKKLDLMEDLSKTMNGQNASRISFESYILASYFDYIIEAANIRFKKMTASRFMLLRRKDSRSKRTKQGLELDILDYETGKIRDIKTLSGGESFKASLSLALGLSDVIQSQAGGIEIDTLFIDEGFGSLDEQSLDQAIQVLYELNHHNKVIGIISHVQELKERIDSKIIVKKGALGSELVIEV